MGANLFQQYLQAPKSIVDYQTEYAKADALNNQVAQQQMALQQAASVNQQRNALRDLVQSGQLDLNDQGGQARALSLAPDVAPGLLKTIQEGKTSAALALKDTAQAGNFNAEAAKTQQATQIAAHQQQLQKLSAVNTPEDAVQWMLDGVNNHSMPPQGLEQSLMRLQRDGFEKWKQQTQQVGLDIQQQMNMTAAKPTEVRLGNVVKFIDTNPRSQTFGQEVTPQQPIGVSPDTVATQAGENARNAATIKKDLTIAGVNPDGTPSADMETTAQAIAKGQLPPPQGMALLNPKNQRILARVMEINPEYDYTTIAAKRKAAADFTTGTLGNAMRSVSTANAHLDQLGELADALQNGNTQVVNKVANYFKTATGDPNVTNFDAIKNIVGQEVVKAIVAGGGSAGERDEAAKAFSDASSPAQLKGAISHYRMVMKAQNDNLLAQRRAAGLPDSTLPSYAQPNALGIDPSAIDAELKRRGGK